VRPRENPFRVSRLESLGFRDPGGATVDSILARLRTAHGRGAIIGRCGSGKTTLLGALSRRLELDGLDGTPIRVERFALRSDAPALDAEAKHAIRGADAQTALLVDGADHLPRHRWLALRLAARRAAVFVVTSHARALLPPIHHTTTSTTLLRELVTELCHGTDAQPPSTEDLVHLLRANNGNIREALRALYDRAAQTPPPKGTGTIRKPLARN